MVIASLYIHIEIIWCVFSIYKNKGIFHTQSNFEYNEIRDHGVFILFFPCQKIFMTQPKILCWHFLSKISTHHNTECHFCELLRPFCYQVKIAKFFIFIVHKHPFFTPKLQCAILKMSGHTIVPFYGKGTNIQGRWKLLNSGCAIYIFVSISVNFRPIFKNFFSIESLWKLPFCSKMGA